MFSRVAGYAHNNLLKLSIQSPFRHCLLQRLSLCKCIQHASFFCLVEGEKICYESQRGNLYCRQPRTP